MRAAGFLDELAPYGLSVLSPHNVFYVSWTELLLLISLGINKVSSNLIYMMLYYIEYIHIKVLLLFFLLVYQYMVNSTHLHTC